VSEQTNADDVTPLNETAIRLHELYLSFVAAGFDADQAIYLVSNLLCSQQ